MKSKLFFSGPLFAYRVPLKGPFGGDEIWPPDLFRHPLDLKTFQKQKKTYPNKLKQNKKCKTLILKGFLITAYFV